MKTLVQNSNSDLKDQLDGLKKCLFKDQKQGLFPTASFHYTKLRLHIYRLFLMDRPESSIKLKISLSITKWDVAFPCDGYGEELGNAPCSEGSRKDRSTCLCVGAFVIHHR